MRQNSTKSRERPRLYPRIAMINLIWRENIKIYIVALREPKTVFTKLQPSFAPFSSLDFPFNVSRMGG